MHRSIVIYDGGIDVKPEDRFGVHVENFRTHRAAQREANVGETGKVVGFIRLDLNDPGTQILSSAVQLAEADSMNPDPPLLELLLGIFLAGRESMK